MVAVIDDGVDISRRDLRTHIKSGTTLDVGPSGHYRFSRRGHGTVMASMLTWVCPMVKIQVIKLQTHPASGKDSLQIDPMSAAKVIEWMFLYFHFAFPFDSPGLYAQAHEVSTLEIVELLASLLCKLLICLNLTTGYRGRR